MRSITVFLLAVSQMSIAATAHAEQGADTPTSQQAARVDTTEIVVTARRRAETLQDVPLSVTAVSGEALQARGVRDALDLQYQTPSLSVTANGASRTSVSYSIRGQRTQEAQLLTDPPVGAYFAEVVMPRTYGFGTAFYDIQNIQVLKGVQGTLFGRNMTGGAVLVEPNHPDLHEFSASATGQYGNYNMVDLTGVVNLPIIKDTLALRVAGKYRDRNGFTKDVSTGLDLDDQHYYAFRGSLEFQSGNLTSFTVFDYLKEDENGTALKLVGYSLIDPRNSKPTVVGQQVGASRFFPVAAGAPPQDLVSIFNSDLALGRRQVDNANFASGPLSSLDQAPYNKIKNWGVTNKTSLDVGKVTFKNIFGYREVDFVNHTDYDGSGAALLEPIQFSDTHLISEEFQMQGKPLGDRLELTLGAYYFQEKGREGAYGSNFSQLTSIGYASSIPALASYFLTLPPSAYTQDTTAYGTASSWAIYGAGTYDLSSTLKLSAGMRYNRDSRKATVAPNLPNLTIPGLGTGFCVFNGLGTYSLDDCAQTKTLKNEAVTWDLTLQYQPNQDLNLYAAARKGYRAGGFSLRAQSDAIFQPFQPEKVQEYEVGMKNTFLFGSARLNTSLALFFQDYKNVQKQNNVLLNSSGTIGTIITNTAAQRNYGGEFEANLALANGLSFNAFYSYVGIDVTKGDNGSYAYQGVPKHQLGGGVTYQHDTAIGELQANVNATYRSRTPLDEFDPISFQDGYALLNARIGLSNVAGTGLGVAVFGSNLTNTYYQIGGIYLMSGGPTANGVTPSGGPGFASAVYGEPRTYGIEVSFKF